MLFLMLMFLTHWSTVANLGKTHFFSPSILVVAWSSWSTGMNVKCLTLVLVRALMMLLGLLPLRSLEMWVFPPRGSGRSTKDTSGDKRHISSGAGGLPAYARIEFAQQGTSQCPQNPDSRTFCYLSCDVIRGNTAHSYVYPLKPIISAHSYVADSPFIHFVQPFKSLTHPQTLYMEFLP